MRIKFLWLFWCTYFSNRKYYCYKTIADDPVQRKQVLTEAAQVVFKNCAPFKNCRTEINDTFVDYADVINITMSMYNLIEYSDNYSDT